jgi:hypothetical protein
MTEDQLLTMTPAQILTVIEQNPGLQAYKIAKIAGISKGRLYRRLDVLKKTEQVTIEGKNYKAVYRPAKCEEKEPQPYQAERTLHLVREIQSLFRPEIPA